MRHKTVPYTLYPIPPQKHQLCYSTVVDTEVDKILQPFTCLSGFMSTCVCSSPLPVYHMDKDDMCVTHGITRILLAILTSSQPCQGQTFLHLCSKCHTVGCRVSTCVQFREKPTTLVFSRVPVPDTLPLALPKGCGDSALCSMLLLCLGDSYVFYGLGLVRRMQNES